MILVGWMAKEFEVEARTFAVGLKLLYRTKTAFFSPFCNLERWKSRVQRISHSTIIERVSVISNP